MSSLFLYLILKINFTYHLVNIKRKIMKQKLIKVIALHTT